MGICKSDDIKIKHKHDPNVSKGPGIILDNSQTPNNFIPIIPQLYLFHFTKYSQFMDTSLLPFPYH